MSDQNLNGKVALVTGASSGIGRTSAMALAREGASVVLGARRTTESEAVAREIRDRGGKAVFVQTDVVDAAQVEALVQRAVDEFGGLDIAMNNAGVLTGDGASLIEDTEENFDRTQAINVKGVWNSIRAEARVMAQHGGGSIINTSSIVGRRGFPGMSAYVVSKHAVEGLTRAAAIELAGANIRVNSVAPGPIKTPMLQNINGGDTSIFEQLVPAGRVGTVEEVAHAVVMLASDGASYISGQSLLVDGAFCA